MNERKKGKTTKTWNIVKTNSKIDTHKYNLIITAININGLNTEIVKLDKIDPTTCCLQETDTLNPKHKEAESERIEKIYHANSKHKRTWVAILLSAEIDIKTKNITRH